MRDKGGKTGGKPGAAGAGGKGRKKKQEKGGSRTFVTSLEEMAQRDVQEEQRQTARKARRREDGEEGGESGEEGGSDDESGSGSGSEGEGEKLVAFERVQTTSLFGFSQKADGPAMEAKPRKKKALIKVENPNLAPKQNKVMKAKDMQGDVEQTLSRREREAIEKEAAAARYLKKHLAGETEEAKRDLARLEEVKRRREEADQRRKEEEAAAAEREKSRKKVATKDDDEPLDARAIKALKPNVLKDKLKERGLSIQGQKKDLIQRLIDYEDERAL